MAHALREWLPTVIQSVEPWMSGSDIDQGARWSPEIATQLEQANIGIICLTPDNVLSPSLHFEAGALSKALDKSRVCTYLLDLDPTDLRWPLADFQATRANKEETKKLLITINKALGVQSLPVERLEKTFDRWWPELEAQITKLPPPGNAAKNRRSDRELLQEILELLRDRRIDERAQESAAVLRTATQRLGALEAELAALQSRRDELQTRREALLDASMGDTEGQAEIALVQERERLEMAIGETIMRLDNTREQLASLRKLASGR